MTMRAAIICIGLAACIAGGSLVLAREPDDHSAVSTEKLIEQALAGEDGKEVVASDLSVSPRRGAALAHPSRRP